MADVSLSLSPDTLLTISESATAAGKSPDSIKRRRRAGAYPGALPNVSTVA